MTFIKRIEHHNFMELINLIFQGEVQFPEEKDWDWEKARQVTKHINLTGSGILPPMYCPSYSWIVWAQNLRQVIVMKISFRTRVSRMRFASFVDINIFVLLSIILFSFFIFSIFFESFESKSTQMLRPQKENSGVCWPESM